MIQYLIKNDASWGIFFKRFIHKNSNNVNFLFHSPIASLPIPANPVQGHKKPEYIPCFL